MSSLGTYLAAGAALGAASEATGATNFTPLGQRARESIDAPNVGGSGPSIDLDLGGRVGGGAGAGQGVNADVLEQLAESFQQQQSGPGALEIAQAMQQAGGGDGGAAGALSDALEQQQQRTDEWRRRWEAAQEGDVDGDGESDVPDGEGVFSLPDEILNLGGSDEGDDSPRSREPTLLDKTERAGEQAEGALRFIGEGANTLGTTVEALGGGDYDTTGTYYGRWFDDGGKTRNIDYPDLPSVDLPSRDDYEKPDETLTEKASNNIRDKLGLSDSSDSSSSSSSTSSSESNDEPVISLPDDLEKKKDAAVRKLDQGNAHQIGGL